MTINQVCVDTGVYEGLTGLAYSILSGQIGETACAWGVGRRAHSRVVRISEGLLLYSESLTFRESLIYRGSRSQDLLAKPVEPNVLSGFQISRSGMRQLMPVDSRLCLL